MSPKMLNYNISTTIVLALYSCHYVTLLLFTTLALPLCSALQPVGNPTSHQAQITHHGLTDHFGLTTIVFVPSNIIVTISTYNFPISLPQLLI